MDPSAFTKPKETDLDENTNGNKSSLRKESQFSCVIMEDNQSSHLFLNNSVSENKTNRDKNQSEEENTTNPIFEPTENKTDDQTELEPPTPEQLEELVKRHSAETRHVLLQR